MHPPDQVAMAVALGVVLVAEAFAEEASAIAGLAIHAQGLVFKAVVTGLEARLHRMRRQAREVAAAAIDEEVVMAGLIVIPGGQRAVTRNR